MKSQKLYFSILVLLSALLLPAHAAKLASAKVVGITGTVTKYSSGGASSPLAVGEILEQGDSISVTALSQAKLVFSNGSELTVEENTSINIAKLEQDSFGGGQTYEQLAADPSKSRTLLELNYGALSGHVKKLQPDSSFDVETPLGTAAIRGTFFTVSLLYNVERGEFSLIVKNIDGLVDIISRYVGQLEWGEGNIGEKVYDSSISEATTEPIPRTHTFVIRIHQDDPYFEDLFDIIENYIPTGPAPVITPGGFGDDDDDDDDDFGVIVVSPEGPQGGQGEGGQGQGGFFFNLLNNLSN